MTSEGKVRRAGLASGWCGVDRLLPFSCKGRGFCGSRTGRRLSDTVAHLLDRVCMPIDGASHHAILNGKGVLLEKLHF